MLQKRLLIGLVMITAIFISSCIAEDVECGCGEIAFDGEGEEFGCMNADTFIALLEEEVQEEVPPDIEAEIRAGFSAFGGACEGGGEPVAPGLWPSDVCEPNGGFSGDGWNTWDTNADELGFSTVLYVGTSAEGPWFATEYTYPPYIFSMSSLQALADWMGVASFEQLWFKVDEAGSAVNWASAIADRDAHMDALCGVE